MNSSFEKQSAGPSVASAEAPDNTGESRSERPLVSVIIPVFNEALLLPLTLASVYRYLSTLEDRYRWELIVVNDGSSDRTYEIAEEFAARHTGVRVIHHQRNRGLGQALKTGYQASLGRYVAVLDCDLSYSPDHIGRLLAHIEHEQAMVVVASPYMPGGRVSHVPWLRRVMSVLGNRFLSAVCHFHLLTVTGMVRLYDGPFIRTMSLRSLGQEISPEIIYKTMLLRGKLAEIPAHLDWERQTSAGGVQRRSSLRILPHVLLTLQSGFHLRPFAFFLIPALLLLTVAAYADLWVCLHVYDAFLMAPHDTELFDRLSMAVGYSFRAFPHTYVVGGLLSILGIQLFSLGMLSLQNKRYFEELFYLSTSILRSCQDGEGGDRHGSSTDGSGVGSKTAPAQSKAERRTIL